LMALSSELSDQLSDDQTRRFERMQTRIDDLMKLIHTWLRAMTVDIDNIRENFGPTSIPDVVSKAVESVQSHAIRKNISIETSMQEKIASVNGDEGTLVEAVVNLIGNSVKYSPIGSEIAVTVEETEDQIFIAVQDNGIGISEEDLPFIFEDFYTGKTKQNTEKSSGLGLALTRRIIEAHEGSISVESVLGQGSTFEICLPILENINSEKSIKNLKPEKIT